eukprot:235614_1
MPWLCFYTISYILLITIIILAMDFSINDNQEAFLKINLFQNNNDRNITSNTTSNATSNTSIESNEPNQSHQNTHNELNMSSQIFNQHNTNTHENITTTSILSQNMFHMNNSLHAQQNLIIQAELLKQKRLKIKRKRAQTNPSEDINKFYHDLNHKQKDQLEDAVKEFNRNIFGSWRMVLVTYHAYQFNLSRCINFVDGNKCKLHSAGLWRISSAYVHSCIIDLFNSRIYCAVCAPTKPFAITNSNIIWHDDEQIVLQNMSNKEMIPIKLWRWHDNFYGYPDVACIWNSFLCFRDFHEAYKSFKNTYVTTYNKYLYDNHLSLLVVDFLIVQQGVV